MVLQNLIRMTLLGMTLCSASVFAATKTIVIQKTVLTPSNDGEAQQSTSKEMLRSLLADPEMRNLLQNRQLPQRGGFEGRKIKDMFVFVLALSTEPESPEQQPNDSTNDQNNVIVVVQQPETSDNDQTPNEPNVVITQHPQEPNTTAEGEAPSNQEDSDQA